MLVLLVTGALRFSTYASASGTLIPITFYTNFGFDSGCTTPSTLATNISLELGACVVTPGLGSFHLSPFPCASGSVQNYVFTDTACGQVSRDYYRGGDGSCYTAYYGAMAAIMLSCDQESPEPPTATTTIPVAAVATGASSSTSSTTPSSSNEGGDDSSATSTSTTDTSSSSASASASEWNSLDLGTRIGIIVSLAVGVPPITLTIYMILQKRRRKADEQQAQAHGTPMQTYPPYAHIHGGGGLHGYFPLDRAGRQPQPPAPAPQSSRAYYNIDLGTRGG
ncbi:hypothetical protein CLCR_10665 [Cladophialophora carrionii]|uniref:Uncharacterized protein n=1 Tax=Cladophialophora carrionii TaxID=86049 RepID=A0A1C1CXQ4_9EURO|nr:hypothetical protein CLCR_10665 [Cladophialophora carrionii]